MALLLVVVALLPLMPTSAAKESPSELVDRVNLDRLPVEVAVADVTFKGQILVADPSRSVFGPEPLLWRESCHHIDLAAHGAGTGRLSLLDGATEGQLEDLDVYLYDASGKLLLEDATESHGIGLHHSVHVASSAADGYVCLSNGARAEYQFVVS